MKMFVTLLALVAVVGVFLLPALAQGPKADPGPEQDRMAPMMKTMGQMQEQMKGNAGHGADAGPHGRMMGMMGQMNSMMQQHRAEMLKLCPGAAAPQPPQKGG